MNISAFRHSNPRGFTLTEIMVTVSIVSVLSGIAMPTYKQYFRKAKTAEVYLGLAAIYNAEEAHFAEHNWYAANLKKLLGGKLLSTMGSHAVYGFNPAIPYADPTCASGSAVDCLTTQNMNAPKHVTGANIKFPQACPRGADGSCSTLAQTYNPRTGPPTTGNFSNPYPPIEFEVHAVMDLDNKGKFDIFGIAAVREGNLANPTYIGELKLGTAKTVFRVCDDGAIDPTSGLPPGLGPTVCQP